MNDSEFMLELLRDGREHSTMNIIERSIRVRGCGITPHSRASDLRRRGHDIDCQYGGKRNGRPIWIYRLVSLSEGGGDSDGSPSDSAGPESTPSLSEAEHGLSVEAAREAGHARTHRNDGRPEQASLFTHQRSPDWA